MIAARFADFSLIGFHFRKASVVPENFIPIYYAAAMGTGALGSLLFGRMMDKSGQHVIVWVFLVSAFFAPCVFLGNSVIAFAGMGLWGLSMGAQDSLLKAGLAPLVPAGKQSSAFGVFDTAYGIAWFMGSALMGLCYDTSISAVVIFSVTLQLAALPLLLFANKRKST